MTLKQTCVFYIWVAMIVVLLLPNRQQQNVDFVNFYHMLHCHCFTSCLFVCLIAAKARGSHLRVHFKVCVYLFIEFHSIVKWFILLYNNSMIKADNHALFCGATLEYRMQYKYAKLVDLHIALWCSYIRCYTKFRWNSHDDNLSGKWGNLTASTDDK